MSLDARDYTAARRPPPAARRPPPAAPAQPAAEKSQQPVDVVKHRDFDPDARF